MKELKSYYGIFDDKNSGIFEVIVYNKRDAHVIAREYKRPYHFTGSPNVPGVEWIRLRNTR
ncbi:MAG: hypothetical protein LBQ73_07240 [Tannerellaceae bacterium]|jgi:hypothetical protein|nr:hypothetical protein [Tannerellaceae bacterium]